MKRAEKESLRSGPGTAPAKLPPATMSGAGEGGSCAPDIRPVTGDGGWDARLEKLNAYFGSRREDFIADLNVHYGVPGHSVAYLLDDFGMPPADVYLAVRIHCVTRRPIALIVNAWQTGIADGWGAVTGRFGILPDSADFEALKGDDRGGFYAKAAAKGPW